MNEKSRSETRTHLFRRGGGFYVVLAVCIAVIGGMAVLGVTGSLRSASGVTTPTTVPTPTTTRNVAAAGRATSVRDARTTVTAASVEVEEDTKTGTLCILPLTNAVVREYSDKPVYWDTLDSWRVHLGVDFAGQAGDTVKAASDGTVREVLHDPLWGDCITIDHGDGQTATYCGVTATCAADASVRAGDPIGTLSAIPCEQSQGAHLHLEWRVGGEAIDPLSVLQGEIRFVEASE